MAEGTQSTAETVKWNPEETVLASEKQRSNTMISTRSNWKVAEVIDCQKSSWADKLLQFRLAAGDDQDRQILSGIAEFYPEPQDLIGKKVVIVANLKPRKMRGKSVKGWSFPRKIPKDD